MRARQAAHVYARSVAVSFAAAGRPADGRSSAGRTRVKQEAWRGHSEEGTVIVRDNMLLTGVLDKSQFGASAFGLVSRIRRLVPRWHSPRALVVAQVHCAYELYGGHTAGRILSTLGRLFTAYLQQHGFSCGIDDLILTDEAERERAQALGEATGAGVATAAQFAGLTSSSDGEDLKRTDDE